MVPFSVPNPPPAEEPRSPPPPHRQQQTPYPATEEVLRLSPAPVNEQHPDAWYDNIVSTLEEPAVANSRTNAAAAVPSVEVGGGQQQAAGGSPPKPTSASLEPN